ncbi:MAG: WG repeat-containing protein [Bacteroidia bacterium]
MILLALIVNSVYAQEQDLVFFKNEQLKYGLKNSKEEIIIKPEYDFMYNFASEIIAVNKGGRIYDEYAKADGGKWGFFDYAGNVLTPLKYDNARPLSNSDDNLFIAVNKGCKFVGASYCNGGKWGLIDKTGKEISLMKYNYIQTEIRSNEVQVALVKIKKKFGYIDATTGKEITPIKYDEAMLFRWYTVAKVKLGKKWGIIDNTGKELIPLIYDKIIDFENDKFKVKQGNREFYIDRNGNEIK